MKEMKQEDDFDVQAALDMLRKEVEETDEDSQGSTPALPEPLAYVLDMDFNRMLDYMCDQMAKFTDFTSTEISAFRHVLEQFDQANGGMTAQWIGNIIASRTASPFDDAMYYFNNALATLPPQFKNANDCLQKAYYNFAQIILGYYFAGIWENYILKADMTLYQLVASTAMFPSPEVITRVSNHQLGYHYNIAHPDIPNPDASWDLYQQTSTPDRRSLIAHDKIAMTGAFEESSPCGSNVFANVNPTHPMHSLFPVYQGYCAYHIWPLDTYPSLYMSLKNMVFLPYSVFTYVDASPDLQQLLQYEVQQRLGYLPSGQQPVPRPSCYSSLKWR